MQKVSTNELGKWRMLNAADVIIKVADYAKRDSTYTPIKNDKSSRWNVTISSRGEYEILATGPKFWDTRANVGGGGAIDLVMYLFKIGFKEAVEKLRKSMP